MSDDTDIDPASRAEALMRLCTLSLGALEVILFTLLGHVMLQSIDPLDAAIGDNMTPLMTAPLVLLTLPALLLAWLDRAPRMALTLVLLAIPAAALIWSGAAPA